MILFSLFLVNFHKYLIMANEQQTASIIDTIYQASLDLSLWEDVVKKLAEELCAHSSMLRVFDDNYRSYNYFVSYGYDKGIQKQYGEYFAHIDPIQDVLRDMPDGLVLPQHAVMSMKDFYRTEFYNDYAKPQGFSHTIGGVFLKDKNGSVQFGMQRTRRQPLYDQYDVSKLKLFVPHLKRAISFNKKIYECNAVNRNLETAISHMPFAVFFLNIQGKVIGLNIKAEELIIDGRLINVFNQKVHFFNPIDNHKFQTTLASVVKHSDHEDNYISLQDDNGKFHHIFVFPINFEKSEMFNEINSYQNGVMVGIFPETNTIKLNSKLCKQVFGFTHSEFEVSQHLVNGNSLERIARIRGVTLNTVKSQLKTLFKKTETQSQSALVQCVLSQLIKEI